MSNASLTRFIRQLRPTLRPGRGGLSDAELLRRWADARDEAAFEVLVWRHGPMVAGVCRRLLPRERGRRGRLPGDVPGPRPQGRGDPPARVGGRLAVPRRLPRRAARPGAPRATAGPVPEPAAPPDDGHLLARPAAGARRGGQPAAGAYRLPFVLCYLDGKTNEEAARQLGCPLGTVLSRLSWARQRLRGRLARRGVALSAGALAAASRPRPRPPSRVSSSAPPCSAPAAGPPPPSSPSPKGRSRRGRCASCKPRWRPSWRWGC